MLDRKPVYLTGDINTDRIVLGNITDDRQLLEICSTNKDIYKKVCDETFFRNRIISKYPETIKWKLSDMSFKKYYLSIIKYISLLQEDFDYQYKPTDLSPELLYLIRDHFRSEYGYHIFNLGIAIQITIKENNYRMLDYLFELRNKSNDKLSWLIGRDSEILEAAVDSRNLPMLKYLLDSGINIHDGGEYALLIALENGYLDVVQYLIERGANIEEVRDEALELAIENKHFDIVEYLQELHFDIVE